MLFWDRASDLPPRWISVDRPHQEHQRHTRKYAEGELGEDKSFYFRGPADALNLRAHNLMIFLQMADGVDDATWLHHLHRGDYTRWFRDAIKDDDLRMRPRGTRTLTRGDAQTDSRESSGMPPHRPRHLRSALLTRGARPDVEAESAAKSNAK